MGADPTCGTRPPAGAAGAVANTSTEVKLSDARTATGRKITARAHATCPSHAAYLDETGKAVYVCTNPEENGHTVDGCCRLGGGPGCGPRPKASPGPRRCPKGCQVAGPVLTGPLYHLPQHRTTGHQRGQLPAGQHQINPPGPAPPAPRSPHPRRRDQRRRLAT